MLRTKNAIKFEKVLRSYGAPEKDLMAFYTSVIRSVLEYGAQVWHGSLTGEQCYDIERIQKRALRIMYPGMAELPITKHYLGAASKPWRVGEKLNA